MCTWGDGRIFTPDIRRFEKAYLGIIQNASQSMLNFGMEAFFNET